MKLLEELIDENFPDDKDNILYRNAGRAIILDENELTPLLFVSKYNYHKIAGGGVEEGEDLIGAVKREILEETGCEIKLRCEVGKIIEKRSKTRFNWRVDIHQISYCFLGKVVDKGEPDFTDEEINDGFKIEWMKLDDAILTIENDKPLNAEGEFITKRDLIFLIEARKIIGNK